MKVPFGFFFLFVLFGILHTHASAAISTGAGSCFHRGSGQVSGAVSFSKPGLFVAADFAVHDLISAGTLVGHNRFTDYRGWKYRRYPLFGRIALHPLNFSFLAELIRIRDKIDLYGGIGAGYVHIAASWYGISSTEIGTPEKSGIKIGQYLGVRYMINDQWQIFAENCGQVTTFSLGAGMRF